MTKLVELTLEVRDLRSYYFTPSGTVKAVDGVNFTVAPGEALGIIGESGSGKSTISWSIMRSLPHPGKIVSGEILYDGKDILGISMEEMRRIRWKKIAMITQSAMNALDPLMRVGDQITEAILVHEDVTKTAAVTRTMELLRQVGLDTFRFKYYPHELSGGTKQRLMIAMALACQPGLIISDEPTTALDVIVQAQILKLLDDLKSSMESTSIIFVSHDLSVVAELCDKIIIMYGGKIMEYAATEEILSNPLHPYTEALLESYPDIEKTQTRFQSIPGNPPDMLHLPKGCVFQPRCRYAMTVCTEETPELVDVGGGHFLACYLGQRVGLDGKRTNTES